MKQKYKIFRVYYSTGSERGFEETVRANTKDEAIEKIKQRHPRQKLSGFYVPSSTKRERDAEMKEVARQIKERFRKEQSMKKMLR